ncbi:LysR family transcriptional regulator [Brachybacterium endophyticum]|nr:LysR family transcriptional regulator [Brachybacterium endophyticum]
MEIHQLRYVELVAREASFTAAARRARVSQSALSTQIAKLERELGHRLFDRGRHGAIPTAAGERLISRSRDALRALDGISETAHELSGQLIGTVRIGAVVGCEMPWLSTGIAGFVARHPGVALSYGEGASDGLLEGLRAGRLDLALVGHAGPFPADLTGTLLVDGPLVVLRPDSPDQEGLRGEPVRPADLKDARVITLPPGTGARAALDRTTRAAGIPLRPTFEANSGAMVIDLVRKGAGTGILAAGMVEPPPEGITVSPLSGSASSSLSLAHRPTPSTATSGLLEMLLDALGT